MNLEGIIVLIVLVILVLILLKVLLGVSLAIAPSDYQHEMSILQTALMRPA